MSAVYCKTFRWLWNCGKLVTSLLSEISNCLQVQNVQNVPNVHVLGVSTYDFTAHRYPVIIHWFTHGTNTICTTHLLLSFFHTMTRIASVQCFLKALIIAELPLGFSKYWSLEKITAVFQLQSTIPISGQKCWKWKAPLQYSIPALWLQRSLTQLNIRILQCIIAEMWLHGIHVGLCIFRCRLYDEDKIVCIDRFKLI